MLKDGKRVCDNCQENEPQFTSGNTELCYECADAVGWLEVLEDY
jgi:hypothetical protein